MLFFVGFWTRFCEIQIFSRRLKQENMRTAINNSKVKFYIGDVREYQSVYEAMNGVDYVFHAAALKQVPSCEFYPMEAIRTNCLGADNVMSAIACGVERVVVLSTDKAVYPINAIGCPNYDGTTYGRQSANATSR